MHKYRDIFCPSGVRLIFSYLIVLSSFSHAAESSVNDAGNVLKRESDLEMRRDLPTSIRTDLLQEGEPVKSDEAELRIQVKKFQIEGSISVVSEEDIFKILAEYENKSLTFKEIQAVARKITQFYTNKGYALASATVPKQEVLDGIVKILINEGSIDPNQPIKFKTNQLRLDENFARSYFDSAFENGVFKQEKLERSILNLNDNPGITSSANLEPGSKSGTTRVVMDVNEGPLLDGSVMADNYGSRYTGSDRLSASLNLNNPSHYGDRLSFYGVTAVEQQFDLLKLNYGLPIGSSGLRANISYTDLQFKLGKELKDSDSTGHARNWTYGLRYPLYRTSMTSLSISGGYDWKSNYNESANQAVSDKFLDVYNTNLILEHVDKFLGGGFSQAMVGYINGDLDLGRFESDDTAKTSGRYQKTNAQLVRIQRGTERLSFQFIWNYQRATKNLDGSEKIILGGPAGIRAYPAGEAAGDEGYRYSIDARYVLATASKVGDVVLSTFYDYGRIWQYDNPGLISGLSNNSYSLQGWGVGLDVIAAGKYSLKTVWAKPIGGNPGRDSSGNDSDGTSRDSRFWLMGTVSF